MQINRLNTTNIGRRRALRFLGAAGVVAGAAATGRLAETEAGAASCLTLAGAQTEGPYWVEENLNRSDIRSDPSDGSVRPGVLLDLTIQVQNVTSAACGPLAGAHVDIWHCDAGGVYSDESVQGSQGHKFLRGYQVTDDDGMVRFRTIYPGWYSGRAVHIHFRIRTYSATAQIGEFVAQLFFDDAVSDTVFASAAPYNTRRARDTRNSNDMVLTGTKNGAIVFVDLQQTAAGYAATAAIGVNLASAAAAPSVSASGVVNGASFVPAIAPGSWVTIFGQNLAAASRSLAQSDLVNGKLPTSLGGVTVTINGQPAFLDYVSPTQINLQAPSDSSTGTVSVTVSNSAGSSNLSSVMLQPVSPGLFASGGYVSAVRVDGTVINGTGAAMSGYPTAAAARPGDVLELYGTGFGPTTPAVQAGALFEGSAPVANPVTVTIGGVPATVSFAGLVGAGLYQINITVPALSPGDYPVVAAVAGLTTQPGVMLKVQS